VSSASAGREQTSAPLGLSLQHLTQLRKLCVSIVALPGLTRAIEIATQLERLFRVIYQTLHGRHLQ
jgi:hypothetical protein